MDTQGTRRFALSRCLGRGGFGEVYLAQMRSSGGIDLKVALKMLRKDLDPRGQAVQRLRDEGKLIAGLDHPVILKVHDLVLLEGRIGLVTEYVEGADLGELVVGLDPVGPRALLQVIGEVADALHLAWTAPLPSGEPMRIVHRDIKPPNIRVSRHGSVKLLDFGIAATDRIERDAKTQTGMILGSPGFMAPERFLDEDNHPASDVFALGATLYEGLVGEGLYEGKTTLQMSVLALDGERHATFMDGRLQKMPLEVPVEVLELCARTLHYEPSQRPAARELADACRELADEMDGLELVRWARQHDWPAPASIADAPLVGRTLTEGTLQATAPVEPVVRHEAVATAELPAEEPSQRREAPARSWWWGGAGVLLGGGGVAVAIAALLMALGGWWMLSPGDDAAAVQPTPELQAEAEPEPEPEPELEPESEPEPEPEPEKPDLVADAEPVQPARTRVAPAPVPDEAAAPQAPEPPSPTSMVRVETRWPVRLVGAAGVVEPGEVPVGHYDLRVDFGGGWVDAGQVQVAAGERWQISCRPMGEVCTVAPD